MALRETGFKHARKQARSGYQQRRNENRRRTTVGMAPCPRTKRSPITHYRFYFLVFLPTLPTICDRRSLARDRSQPRSLPHAPPLFSENTLGARRGLPTRGLPRLPHSNITRDACALALRQSLDCTSELCRYAGLRHVSASGCSPRRATSTRIGVTRGRRRQRVAARSDRRNPRRDIVFGPLSRLAVGDELGQFVSAFRFIGHVPPQPTALLLRAVLIPRTRSLSTPFAPTRATAPPLLSLPVLLFAPSGAVRRCLFC